MVLGQVKTREKSNEIKAIPELLDILDINRCIVTIDAMCTQKEIAAKIKEKKADYVLSLKGNHPLLNEEVSSYFDTTLDDKIEKHKVKHCRIANKGHGRIEFTSVKKSMKTKRRKAGWNLDFLEQLLTCNK